MNASRNDPERTATAVVDVAFRIHVRLGPGLLESVYEALLAYELRRRGHKVVRQKTFVNFGGMMMKEGLSRVVNDHDEAGSPLQIAQGPSPAPPRWTRLRRWIRRRRS